MLSIVNSAAEDYWDDVAHRKQFFDEFAKTHNFDPLVPHEWYAISEQQIRDAKVIIPLLNNSSHIIQDGSKLLNRYSGSMYQALADTYINIGLQKSGFSISGMRIRD